MIGHPVASRYAEAFFEFAKSQGRLEEASKILRQLAELLKQHELLQALLMNPAIETDDKLAVLDRVLGDWPEEVRACIRMVLAKDRAETLEEIVEAFGALVDDARGIARVRVRTARPLVDDLKSKLIERLERLGHRHVEMTEETDPSLLGGIQVFIGHRVFDGSLRTQLAQLRQRLKTVRVH